MGNPMQAEKGVRMLRCSTCKEIKRKTDFYASKKLSRGFDYHCKVCRRAITAEHARRNPEKKKVAYQQWADQNKSHLAKKSREYKHRYLFGLEPEDYRDLVEAQGGVCAICRTAGNRLCVDHDHGTGEVRGILCTKCNLTLGYYENGLKMKTHIDSYLSTPPARKVLASRAAAETKR